MGFGGLIDASAQNNLTSLQTSTNLLGGEMQQEEANTQATALQGQAQQVLEQTGLQAEQATLQYQSAEGQQAESYSSAGVDLSGTPSTIINETRMMGEQQVNAIQQAGTEQAQLLQTQANLTQQTGLADLLGAQGENQVTQQQNSLSQAQQQNQLLEGLFGGGLSAGVGLLGSAMPSIIKAITGP